MHNRLDRDQVRATIWRSRSEYLRPARLRVPIQLMELVDALCPDYSQRHPPHGATTRFAMTKGTRSGRAANRLYNHGCDYG